MTEAQGCLCCRPPFKLGQGRAEGPRHDPPPRHTSPEWGPQEEKGDVHNEAVNKNIVTMSSQSPDSIQKTADTSQTCLQAGTQTKEADMRTSKVQCDPQTTSRPVEKGHHRGWLVPVTINQVATMARLDTGATCTMIGRPLYELVQAAQPLKVKQDENLRLEVIGGGAAPTLGTATVRIGIAGGSYEHEIVISANRENLNCILGSDFFCQHDCELSMRKQQFQVCVPEPSRGAIAGLKTARRVELPARTEVIVLCKPTRASSWLQWGAAVAQPCSDQWRYAEDGLVIGSALKTPDQSETVIPVMNLTDEPRTLYRGTEVGEAHAVTQYDRVEGQLPIMSRYECDSEDSEDEGWLRDGCVKYRPDITLQGRAAFRPTWVDIRMDPADLPEYLQPLMEGVSEDLTLRQREELAAAIYEHRDVFSSGPTDMGRTGLVKHTIDTGDQRPVRLPKRRLPIAKQEIEKGEVQKMLNRGVIEPCQSSWASPVVLVMKKDGTTRFCVDYWKLNDVTKKDAYPLPRIDDTLAALRGSMYFSTLDLYSGYWQVELDQGDIDKTAFVTRQGLFRFTVMPFRLCNAPATFERLMELVLKDLN